MKNQIIIFGGAFNPPLNSHFSIAQQLLNEYEEVDKVAFVPLNQKYGKADMLNNEHRYQMLKLVVDKNPHFVLSDIDIKSERSLHSFEHIDIIQQQFPDKEMCLLMGSDNLRAFYSWSNPELIISCHKIYVMERGEDNIEDIIKSNALLNSYAKNIIKVPIEIKSNFNSTYVRTQLKKGKDIRYLVPDEVYYYIKENNLYKA